MEQERIANILRGIMNMLMLLAVFFLGYNAAGWTNQQIREYCVAYSNATMVQWQQSFIKNFTFNNSNGVNFTWT